LKILVVLWAFQEKIDGIEELGDLINGHKYKNFLSSQGAGAQYHLYEAPSLLWVIGSTQNLLKWTRMTFSYN
jgi:hypothetical protein